MKNPYRIGIMFMLGILAFTLLCELAQRSKFRFKTFRNNSIQAAKNGSSKPSVSRKATDNRNETEKALNKMGLSLDNSVGVSVVSRVN